MCGLGELAKLTSDRASTKGHHRHNHHSHHHHLPHPPFWRHGEEEEHLRKRRRPKGEREREREGPETRGRKQLALTLSTVDSCVGEAEEAEAEEAVSLRRE